MGSAASLAMLAIPAGPGGRAQPVPDPVAASPDAPVVSEHDGTFDGTPIHYQARVETADVHEASLPGGARIVSYAYLARAPKGTGRPVIFLFNGGPIVPSIWLQLGAMGPKRVAVPADPAAPASTYRLVDNACSPLDVADLVFIDVPTTGYSQTLPGTPPGAFHSVEADARLTADFIAQWLAGHGRADTPFYVLGESYGTIRAVEAVRMLAQRPRPLLANGVILFGQADNIVEYVQRPTNIMSYVASLETEAAVAWYHGRADKRGKDFAGFLHEVEVFSQHDYLDALDQGNLLPEARKRNLAMRLARYTGIPVEWYLAHDLKITKQQFRVELLRDRHLLLGQADARYAAPITGAGGAVDPAGVINAGFERLWQDYLRDDLHVRRSDPYRFDGDVGGLSDWNWGGASPFSDWPWPRDITDVMQRDPHFRVMVGNGWTDMQTTVGAARLLLRQSGWPRDRAELHLYDGGHQFYTVAGSAKAATDDVRSFVGKAGTGR